MIKSISKKLIKLLEIFVIVIMTALVLDVIWGVASRYLLGDQSSWTEELARVLLIWVSLMGASLAFAEKSHLGVDYLMTKLHPEAARFMAITTNIIILIAIVLIFLVGGFQLMQRTFSMNQIMPAMNIPKGYVYSVVPLSGIFTVIFIINNIIALKNMDPNDPELMQKQTMVGEIDQDGQETTQEVES